LDGGTGTLTGALTGGETGTAGLSTQKIILLIVCNILSSGQVQGDNNVPFPSNPLSVRQVQRLLIQSMYARSTVNKLHSNGVLHVPSDGGRGAETGTEIGGAFMSRQKASDPIH